MLKQEHLTNICKNHVKTFCLNCKIIQCSAFIIKTPIVLFPIKLLLLYINTVEPEYGS